MEDLLGQAVNCLLVGLGLTDNELTSAFTGCHFGNILITGKNIHFILINDANLNFQIKGPRGSGRTSIVKFLCQKLESHPYFAHVHFIECSTLKGGHING